MTVTLNKDEILQRANGLMRKFADAHYEMGEAQNFIPGLYDGRVFRAAKSIAARLQGMPERGPKRQEAD